jgi:hypothetical protein
LFPLFATGGKFAPSVVDTGGKLPPVTLTPVSKTLANWWQNLPPVSLKPVANLPPVTNRFRQPMYSSLAGWL